MSARKPKEKKVMVYIPMTPPIGSIYIVAEELGHKDGKIIMIKDPAFVQPSADGRGYDLQPVKFVDEPHLFIHALLLIDRAPQALLPFYEKYQSGRNEQRQYRPE